MSERRTLAILWVLAGERWRTLDELAREFECHQRSVRRSLASLQANGIGIDARRRDEAPAGPLEYRLAARHRRLKSL